MKMTAGTSSSTHPAKTWALKAARSTKIDSRSAATTARPSFSKRAFVAALQRLLPELRKEDVRPAGSGVRAQAMDPKGNLLDDFHVIRRERMIHVVNAPSPAATSSLGIAKTIAEMAAEHLGI
jgi:L-2-hydroxyglutarate oxidase LhgO